MRIRILGLLCLGLMVSLATDAKANFVLDGNFVSAPNPGATGITPVPIGATTIPNWNVVQGLHGDSTGSVDIIGSNFFPTPAGSAAGTKLIDLDGTSTNPVGGITQTIAGLIVGQTYSVSFTYANNPNAFPSASATVSIDGSSDVITHSGSSVANPGYVTGTFTFVANGNNLLSAISNDPAGDFSGILITNFDIELSAVPEPASLAMLGLGLVAVGGYVRARRRTA